MKKFVLIIPYLLFSISASAVDCGSAVNNLINKTIGAPASGLNISSDTIKIIQKDFYAANRFSGSPITAEDITDIALSANTATSGVSRKIVTRSGAEYDVIVKKADGKVQNLSIAKVTRLNGDIQYSPRSQVGTLLSDAVSKTDASTLSAEEFQQWSRYALKDGLYQKGDPTALMEVLKKPGSATAKLGNDTFNITRDANGNLTKVIVKGVGGSEDITAVAKQLEKRANSSIVNSVSETAAKTISPTVAVPSVTVAEKLQQSYGINKVEFAFLQARAIPPVPGTTTFKVGINTYTITKNGRGEVVSATVVGIDRKIKTITEEVQRIQFPNATLRPKLIENIRPRSRY